MAEDFKRDVPVNAAAAAEPAAATQLGKAGLWVLKTAGVWLLLMVTMVASTRIVPVSMSLPPPDGPLSMGQALLLVNGLVAVALSALAARARVGGWRLAVLMFVALYGIQTAVMQIETVYFNEAIKMPLDALAGYCVQAAVAAAMVAAALPFLFRPAAEPIGFVPAHMTLRIAALVAIYVALYWSAGLFIAMQSPAVRAFYSGMHIEPLPTLLLQVFRGTLWALISLYVVTRIKGSLLSRVAIMGMLFAILTAAQLLYPNPLAPWAIRQVHLVEVSVSELAYGIAATLVLIAGSRPLAQTSRWRLLAGRT